MNVYISELTFFYLQCFLKAQENFIFFLTNEKKFYKNHRNLYQFSFEFYCYKKKVYKKKPENFLRKLFQANVKFYSKIFLGFFDFSNHIVKRSDLFHFFKFLKNFFPPSRPLTRYTLFTKNFRFNLISNFFVKNLLEIYLNTWKKIINKCFLSDRKLNILFNFSLLHQIKILNFKKKLVRVNKNEAIWYDFHLLFTNFLFYFTNFQITPIWQKKKKFFSFFYNNLFLLQQVKTVIFYIQKWQHSKTTDKLFNFLNKKKQEKIYILKKNLKKTDQTIFFNGQRIPKWLYKSNDYKKEYSCNLCKKKKFRGKKRFRLHFYSKYHFKMQQKKVDGRPRPKN